MTELTDKFDGSPGDAPPFRAAMLHDWLDVTMIHFAVPPGVVAGLTPYAPDVFHPPFRGRVEGKRSGGEPGRGLLPSAWVSLVMFELHAMRVPLGHGRLTPKLTRFLLRPISDHRFVNLRTYVNHRGRRGIYFIREWLDNRLSVALGPVTFGVPYHFGVIRPDRVVTPEGTLAWRVDPPIGEEAEPVWAPARPGTVDHFLLERYTAFTHLRHKPGCFHIRHAPWPIRRVHVEVTDTRLLRATTGRWLDHAQHIIAHQSPGVRDVEVSRPYRSRVTRTTPQPLNPACTP